MFIIYHSGHVLTLIFLIIISYDWLCSCVTSAFRLVLLFLDSINDMLYILCQDLRNVK